MERLKTLYKKFFLNLLIYKWMCIGFVLYMYWFVRGRDWLTWHQQNNTLFILLANKLYLYFVPIFCSRTCWPICYIELNIFETFAINIRYIPFSLNWNSLYRYFPVILYFCPSFLVSNAISSFSIIFFFNFINSKLTSYCLSIYWKKNFLKWKSFKWD